MKLKLQFIIAACIALVIYIPVAHGQANLTFSGGSGTPLSTTLQTSVIYTVNNEACVGPSNGPIFIFDEVGNPFRISGSIVTGTITFSINGGPPQSITTENSGANVNAVSPNDLFIEGALPDLSVGDTVVLSAGTVTTNTTVASARPNNGSFPTFIVNDGGVRCSTNGVAATPTAATVSLSGRVMTAGGGSIMNVRLSLTDSHGNVRTAITDSTGYYQFDDVQAGETYVLSATGKRYSFSQPVQVLNINEEASQVNFIANSEKRSRVF
jgi:hypothetical protein